MALLPILEFPDPRLRKKAAPVAQVDDALRRVIDDLFETMYAAPGIGLAATQVDIHQRLLVADVSVEKNAPHVLINPEIIEESEDPHVYKEGCLSFPEQFADVTRPKDVRVRYLDLQGKQQEETLTGLLATCVQHEIDHLNGIVFVDHISSLKRDMILRKLKKMKKQGYFDHDHSNCGHDHSHDHHGHVHDEHCDHDHKL
jgi:peptide deformylase